MPVKIVVPLPKNQNLPRYRYEIPDSNNIVKKGNRKYSRGGNINKMPPPERLVSQFGLRNDKAIEAKQMTSLTRISKGFIPEGNVIKEQSVLRSNPVTETLIDCISSTNKYCGENIEAWINEASETVVSSPFVQSPPDTLSEEKIKTQNDVRDCAKLTQTIEESSFIEQSSLQTIINQTCQNKFTQKYEGKSIHITEKPRVVVIAEKFYKSGNVNFELRRLEEKIVCLEYDIFQNGNLQTPVQVMRVYLSLVPKIDDNGKGDVCSLGDSIKENHLIEVIDETVKPNKQYLDDLKRIMINKKQIKEQISTNSHNLLSLYEMAKHNMPTIDSNIVPPNNLQEMKQYLSEDNNSVCCMSRKIIKCTKGTDDAHKNLISESIIRELWKDQCM